MKRTLTALSVATILCVCSSESQAQDVTDLLPVQPASGSPLNLGSLLEVPLQVLAPVAQEETNWVRMEANWIANETHTLAGDTAELYFNLNPITNTAEGLGLFDRRPILSLFGR